MNDRKRFHGGVGRVGSVMAYEMSMVTMVWSHGYVNVMVQGGTAWGSVAWRAGRNGQRRIERHSLSVQAVHG